MRICQKTLHHSQLLVPHLLHRHNKSIHLEMGLRTHHCDMAHIHGAHSHHVLLCICALWLLLLFWRFAATWQETDTSRVRSKVDQADAASHKQKWNHHWKQKRK